MNRYPTVAEAQKLIQTYGSPLFITYKDVLIRNIERYRNAFSRYRGGFTLAYSVKTNSNIALLKIFREENVMAEICSSVDITASELAGYTGDKMLFDGLIKTDVELEKAVKDKFSILNIESFDEAQRLAKIAQRFDRRVNVGIRLSFPSARIELKSLLGISYDRFGVSFSSGEAARIAEFIINNKCFNLAGLHCHRGSNQKSTKTYLMGIDELVNFMIFLKKQYNIKIKILNLGGGFGIPEVTAYQITDIVKQALKRLFGQPISFSPVAFCFEKMGDQIISYLEKKLEDNNLDFPYLMLEPGRSLIGNTTHLLTTVLERKETKYNNWVIIDAGTNLLPVLTLYSESHDIKMFTKNTVRKKVSIAGPLLYSSDIIISSLRLPQVEVGDIVMICDVGAYFNCQSNQFLYPRPATVLIDGDNHQLIQRREKIKDIFMRDIY